MALDPLIFTSCPEKWSDMTPAERGRMCAKCRTQVVDFRGMSDDEIKQMHVSSPERICGLYSLSQFQRPTSKLAAAAAAAALGLTALGGNAYADLHEPDGALTVPETIPSDSILVAGTVTDSTTQQPIAGAQVILVGARWGAITDSAGHFRFVVRDSVESPVRVQVQILGYDSKTVVISDSGALADLRFALTQTFVGIVGIIVTGETRPPVPRKPSFWQRVWRIFF